MNTLTTLVYPQITEVFPDLEHQSMDDLELDAMLAIEEAELENMQIVDGRALAELQQLMSDTALSDLDAMTELDDLALAS